MQGLGAGLDTQPGIRCYSFPIQLCDLVSHYSQIHITTERAMCRRKPTQWAGRYSSSTQAPPAHSTQMLPMPLALPVTRGTTQKSRAQQGMGVGGISCEA